MRLVDKLRGRGRSKRISDAALQASFKRAEEVLAPRKFGVAGIVKAGDELTISYRTKRRQITLDQLKAKVAGFYAVSTADASAELVE